MKKSTSYLSFFVLAFMVIGNSTFAQERAYVPRFKRLVFHTGVCFGFCPVYHMEINKKGKVRVYREKVFDRNNSQGKNFVIDSVQVGYFKGKISKKTVRRINELIDAIGLLSMPADSTLCCDGSLKTIITYVDGKRHEYKTMFPRDKMEELTALLSEIASTKGMKKVKRAFKIEEVTMPE